MAYSLDAVRVAIRRRMGQAVLQREVLAGVEPRAEKVVPVGTQASMVALGGESGSAGVSGGWPTGGSGGGGTGGSSETGGVGGSTQPDASPDVNFEYDAPVTEASLEDACVDETAAAKPVPLDIYFMLDASTSMSIPAGSGAQGDCNVAPPFSPSVNSRWCNAVNAVAGYVSDSSVAGNRAAIGYFKHYTSHNCNGSGYDTPMVALGTLSGGYTGHAKVIVEQAYGGLNWAYPFSNTPTGGALNGLVKFTAANKTPGRVIIGILITDGAPNECESSDSGLRNIAQTHFNNTGIHTFMVGIEGSAFQRLEAWASYTGAIKHDDTNDACGNCNNCECHHYNVGKGNPAVFIEALKKIQKSVLSCTFQVPEPSQGVLDPDLVRVDYFPNGQPPPIELPRVNSAGDCSGPGWYYDNPTNPTTVNLCPDSCSTIQADSHAEIKIRIACQAS